MTIVYPSNPFCKLKFTYLVNFIINVPIYIIETLRDGTIDIGFTSEFNVKGLEFIPLFKDPCRLIVSNQHPFASYDKIPISALNGCEMIAEPPGGDEAIKAVKKKHKFTPVVRYYIHADAAAQAMVAANLGAYIIPDLQCHTLPEGIKVIEFEEGVYRVMGCAVKSLKKTSSAVKEIINIAKIVTDKYNFTQADLTQSESAQTTNNKKEDV